MCFYVVNLTNYKTKIIHVSDLLIVTFYVDKWHLLSFESNLSCVIPISKN